MSVSRYAHASGRLFLQCCGTRVIGRRLNVVLCTDFIRFPSLAVLMSDDICGAICGMICPVCTVACGEVCAACTTDFTTYSMSSQQRVIDLVQLLFSRTY